VVLDDFMFVLYVGGLGAEFAGIHDGAEFTAAATDGPVAVYVTDGVDVRRSRPADLDEAAANGRLLGASVAAFVVQSL